MRSESDGEDELKGAAWLPDEVSKVTRARNPRTRLISSFMVMERVQGSSESG